MISGRKLPSDVQYITFGKGSDGEDLYVCRAYHEGCVQIGKAGYVLCLLSPRIGPRRASGSFCPLASILVASA